MPNRNTQIMDGQLMRQLFACAAIDAYLQKEDVHLKNYYTDPHRIGRLQQWIEVALQAAEYCITPGFSHPVFQWLFDGDIDFGINFMVFVRKRYKKATPAEKRLLLDGLRRSMENIRNGQSKYSPDESIIKNDPSDGKEVKGANSNGIRAVREKYIDFQKKYGADLQDMPVALVKRHYPKE